MNGQTIVRGLAAILAAGAVACSTWQGEYLRANVGKATQADVRQHLGEPSLTRSLEGGGSEWLYHYFAGKLYSELVEGHVGGRQPDCTEYLLTFDERNVLSDWRKQACD
ncbi:hypothetical protein [Nitrospira sp. Kam-Ns4a]